jgi:hypothetical protein
MLKKKAMKKIIFNLLTLLPFLSIGQSLPIDETGHIMYIDVVKADSLSKDLLFHNAEEWITSLEKEKENETVITYADSLGGELSGHSSFFVYTQSGVFRKVSGKVSYSFTVEVKDSKFRYQFKDFTYHYYTKDRYFHPVETNRQKKLEDVKASGWQKQWEDCKLDTHRRMVYLIKGLKAQMFERDEQASKKLATNKEMEW